jgi:hypothetical protein
MSQNRGSWYGDLRALFWQKYRSDLHLSEISVSLCTVREQSKTSVESALGELTMQEARLGRCGQVDGCREREDDEGELEQRWR